MPEASLNIQSEPGSPQAKQAAKQCLVNADRYVKDQMFREAKAEVEKARKLDPSNVYLHAFLERIAHFEQEQKKNGGPKPAPSAAPRPAPATSGAGAVAQPKPAPAASAAPQAKVNPQPSPQPVAAPSVPRPAAPSAPATPPVAPPAPVHAPSPPPEPVAVPEPAPFVPTPPPPPPPKPDVDAKLDEMRRQIEMLTAALEAEKKAREEVLKHQLQNATQRLRAELQRAWVNGAPEKKDANDLHTLAVSLGIPENVEKSIIREVKLDMYSRAVKEVITKRQLLRSSSSTLEWLRKVYQISVEEYLEYESKFLMDLVADQYKGTLFLVVGDEKLRDEMTPRLKGSGYAVVQSATAEDALEKIEKINPNLIIADMEFGPGNLSGIKFLHVLRANSKFSFIPFILLCSTADAKQLATSELRPNEGYTEKPVDFDELTLLMNEKLLHLREYISSLS